VCNYSVANSGKRWNKLVKILTTKTNLESLSSQSTKYTTLDFFVCGTREISYPEMNEWYSQGYCGSTLPLKPTSQTKTTITMIITLPRIETTAHQYQVCWRHHQRGCLILAEIDDEINAFRLSGEIASCLVHNHHWSITMTTNPYGCRSIKRNRWGSRVIQQWSEKNVAVLTLVFIFSGFFGALSITINDLGLFLFPISSTECDY